VGVLGEKDWNKIAGVVEGRTSRQCRERFKNHLKEGIKKGPWSPEEDSLILKVHPARISRSDSAPKVVRVTGFI
jgi:hypothetical protein